MIQTGINPRNFHHCTKQRKLQFLDQKGVAKGRDNKFEKSPVDGNYVDHKIFHTQESIIIP